MEDKQVEEIKRHFDVVVEGCLDFYLRLIIMFTA